MNDDLKSQAEREQPSHPPVDASSYATLIIEQIDRVRRITLNRPEKRNALSSQLLHELVEAVEDASRDLATRVVLLRGAGPSFSSGYDVTDSRETPGATNDPAPSIQHNLNHLLDVNEQLARIWKCRIPVLAQVHGHCLAGGTDLALHCDIVIVASNARIGYPPARFFGVPPNQMWIYNVGPQWTKRLLWGCDSISGRMAAEIGFALEAVPEEELEVRALRHASQVARTNRDSLIGSKMVANQGIELMGRSALQAFAAAHDAIGHAGPQALEFRATIREVGIARAIAEQNSGVADDMFNE